jgi:DNA polymerase I
MNEIPSMQRFREIVVVDFEFLGGDTGDHYDVVCMAARELRSGRAWKLWRDGLGAVPPYPTDGEVVVVCFAAHAELGCHLSLGWPLPKHVLDLSPEYKNFVNGRA